MDVCVEKEAEAGIQPLSHGSCREGLRGALVGRVGRHGRGRN